MENNMNSINKSFLKSVFKKYKEPILYIIFGVLTTAVSIAVFWFFTEIIVFDELIANIISWIIAVLFAFLTNRKWVFAANKNQNFFIQAVKFYSGRLITLLIEEVIIFIFITLLSLNSLMVKIAAQFIVIVLNYVISKLYIFKK
jgi:putative flippase GtrA